LDVNAPEHEYLIGCRRVQDLRNRLAMLNLRYLLIIQPNVLAKEVLWFRNRASKSQAGTIRKTKGNTAVDLFNLALVISLAPFNGPNGKGVLIRTLPPEGVGRNHNGRFGDRRPITCRAQTVVLTDTVVAAESIGEVRAEEAPLSACVRCLGRSGCRPRFHSSVLGAVTGQALSPQ